MSVSITVADGTITGTRVAVSSGGQTLLYTPDGSNKEIQLVNNGTMAVDVGPTGVTVGTGIFVLQPLGGSVDLPVLYRGGVFSTTPIYGIAASGTGDVSVVTRTVSG